MDRMDRMDDRRRTEDEPVEAIAEDVAAHNPDPVTRRESIEQELAERGRSDEGTQIGDEID